MTIMTRRSVRKKARMCHGEAIENPVSLAGTGSTLPKTEISQQSQEEILRCHIEVLNRQTKSLHEAVDAYVSKVKLAGTDFLDKKEKNQETFKNIGQMVENTLVFISQNYADVSQSCASVPDIGEEPASVKENCEKPTTLKEGMKKPTRSSKRNNKIPGTKPKSVKCEICEREFSSKAQLSAHRRGHFYEFKYKCGECARKFQFKSQLERHKLSHSGEQPFKCEVCNKCFQGRQGLEKHQEKHLPEKPIYKCDICQKIVSSKNYLAIHMRFHSKDNPHKCHICGKGYVNFRTLHDHFRTHTGEKPFTCEICKTSFRRKTYLDKHIKCTHAKEKLHQCDECGKKFVDKYYMNIHKQLHRSETPYLCDYCGKGYKNKYTLKSHKLTHTDITPHICDICGKGFKFKGALNLHRKTHSSEKPHKCDVCSKCFRDKHQLASHKWVHAEERPHKCDVCGKSFPYQRILAMHKRIHSVDRPYKCEVCGKAFKRDYDIRKHKMKVHEKKRRVGSGEKQILQTQVETGPEMRCFSDASSANSNSVAAGIEKHSHGDSGKRFTSDRRESNPVADGADKPPDTENVESNYITLKPSVGLVYTGVATNSETDSQHRNLPQYRSDQLPHDLRTYNQQTVSESSMNQVTVPEHSHDQVTVHEPSKNQSPISDASRQRSVGEDVGLPVQSSFESTFSSVSHQMQATILPEQRQTSEDPRIETNTFYATLARSYPWTTGYQDDNY